tara:strand:- start:35 stop:922 length:888 start_codon:yes stop_codon:yes gene_type:complete
MYPILFEYNNFQISTYGFMLMMAFVLSNYLLKKYLISIDVNANVGEDLIFYAALGGILGAKIFYIIEYFDTDGYDNILGLLNIFKGIYNLSFSLILTGIKDFGSGLVFLGGLFGGMLSVSIYIYNNKLNWFEVSDWIAPYLALGHGIGRLGCFFVGCCYGIPSNHPWLFSFSYGRPPTTYESFKYYHPNIFDKLVKPFYNPGDFISVHPTQLYEFFIYISIFIYLLYSRNNKKYDGHVFYKYMFCTGLFRFLIEYYRLNPIYLSGLTSAQIISMLMTIFSGSFLLYNVYKKQWKK